jgi:hypothetical protein
MPLFKSAQEVKDILGLTGTSYDEQIEIFMPLVQEDLCEYLNNYFDDPFIYRDATGGITFARGTTGTTESTNYDYIEDTYEYFSTCGFTTDREFDILVQGGGGNAGIHHVVSMSTAGGKFTLDSTGELVDLDMDNSYNPVGRVKISLVNWPKSLKIAAARMIWYLIKRVKETDVKSESIDDYSVTYVGGHAYPESIVRGLSKWRKVILV